MIIIIKTLDASGFGFAELVVVVVIIIKTLYKQALLVHW